MFVTLFNKVKHRLCNTPALLCCKIKVISDTDKPSRSQMDCRCLWSLPGSWTWWPLRVPSNQTILWFYDPYLQQHCCYAWGRHWKAEPLFKARLGGNAAAVAGLVREGIILLKRRYVFMQPGWPLWNYRVRAEEPKNEEERAQRITVELKGDQLFRSHEVTEIQ